MMLWSLRICHADWVLFVILSMETVKLSKNTSEDIQKSLWPVTVISSQYFNSSHIWLISSWILNRNILENNHYIAEEARQTMHLLYARRKFEICVLAFKIKPCQLCNVAATTQEVNMRTNGKPIFPEQPRKFICKKKTVPTRASDLMKKVSVIGQKFWTYITSDEDHQNFPMFIKKGEYNHGVAWP